MIYLGIPGRCALYLQSLVKPNSDRLAQNLEIIFKNPTGFQISAYDHPELAVNPIGRIRVCRNSCKK